MFDVESDSTAEWAMFQNSTTTKHHEGGSKKLESRIKEEEEEEEAAKLDQGILILVIKIINVYAVVAVN
jgi:hypothetical protein